MRRINRNEAVWFIILLGLSFCIFYFVATGRLTNFIHPRMTVYVYLALGALMVMAAFQATRMFQEGEEHIRKGYIAFLLPFICIMLLHPGELDENAVQGKGIIISQQSSQNEYRDGTYVEASIRNGIITLTEDNFADVLYSIWSSPEEYQGRRIKAEGFVYEVASGNQLIIARMVINCCAADSLVLGIASQYGGEKKLKDNEWVSVEGTIRMLGCINPSTNKEEKVTGMVVDSLEIIEKPRNPYIYP